MWLGGGQAGEKGERHTHPGGAEPCTDARRARRRGKEWAGRIEHVGPEAVRILKERRGGEEEDHGTIDESRRKWATRFM